MAAPFLPADLRALRTVVPRHCFQPDVRRSLRHLLRDLLLLAALQLVSVHVDHLALLLPLWLAQGTLLWALFVIGHDCGHGAFSGSRRVDTIVGHALHTPLLVPFHSWRISHRIHHRHTADIDRDETWFPLTESQWWALSPVVRILRTWLLPFVFPLYLWRRTPERSAGSHFDPEAEMFPDDERALVRTSVRACMAMAALLVLAAAMFGPFAVVKHWLVPYLVFCAWLDVVTYLHHTDARLPWFRGKAWTWQLGALSTVDRRYGLLESIHHDAGCHVVHHLFPTIPHYHLREAAAAIRPILGERYCEGRDSALGALVRAQRKCRVVPPDGDVVYYERLSPRSSPARSGAGASPITT